MVFLTLIPKTFIKVALLSKMFLTFWKLSLLMLFMFLLRRTEFQSGNQRSGKSVFKTWLRLLSCATSFHTVICSFMNLSTSPITKGWKFHLMSSVRDNFRPKSWSYSSDLVLILTIQPLCVSALCSQT